MELTVNNIKNLEQKIFPELNFSGDDIQYKKSSHNEHSWVFFAPHFYAEQPALLTAKFVKKLQDNGQVLSVGSGPAYLEQFLVKAYNVPAKNITLCDKFCTDVVAMPKKLRFIQFDMNNPWPDFSQKFDYIIFPESVFFGSSVDETDKDFYNMKVNMFSHLLKESLAKLKPEGEIIMKGMIPSERVVNSVINKIPGQNITLEYRYGTGSLLRNYLSIRR